MSWHLIAMIVCLPAMALHIWAEGKCTEADVAQGLRDRMALVDDYGCNRGWHWKWKMISIPCALLAAPGLFIWAGLTLAFVFQR